MLNKDLYLKISEIYAKDYTQYLLNLERVQFGPFNIIENSAKSTKVKTSNLAQVENGLSTCHKRVQVETDIKLAISRINNYWEGQISYLRTDTFEQGNIDFYDYKNEYMCMTFNSNGLTCHSTKPELCKDFPVGEPVPAIILSLNINPVNGSAGEKKYDLQGSYQTVSCGSQRKKIEPHPNNKSKIFLSSIL